MKRFLDTTAMALALALGVGVVLLAPSPAQAACIPIGALDFNGDGWIDTPERHMAMDAGFTNVRSGGRLYTSQEEMSACLTGSAAAMRWLQSANPNFASSMGTAPAGSTTMVGRSVTPSPSRYYSMYDSGAAYDTPSPVAHENALSYLRTKVFGSPAGAAQGTIMAPSQPMASSGSPSEFERIDANRDGIVSQGEWLDYRNRLGQNF
jgi:hypothetical protein